MRSAKLRFIPRHCDVLYAHLILQDFYALQVIIS